MALRLDRTKLNPAIPYIYIFDTDNSIWDIFIIKSSNYRIEFCHGENSSTMPDTFKDVKKLQETDPTILKIFVNKSVQVNCHFFIEDEIELDIDPKEISDKCSYDSIISFMYWLSFCSGKLAYLTNENSPDQIILFINN